MNYYTRLKNVSVREGDRHIAADILYLRQQCDSHPEAWREDMIHNIANSLITFSMDEWYDNKPDARALLSEIANLETLN